MVSKYVILLAIGAVSWGTDSLEYTREYRGIPNPKGLCLAGVQHRYKDYLGEELWIYTFSGELVGPLLVVDVAAPEDKGIMESNGLAIDINCEDLVHTNGILLMFDEEMHNHPDILNFGNNDSVVSRVRNRLNYPHYLCAHNPRVACIKQLREWLN